MEAMDASGSRLCQIIQGAGLRPRTVQRLEAALAAQRLAMQEIVDLHIHVYEEIVYIGHYKASEDRKMLAFF